tara:strand:- start:3300 stop:3620 length:321 start_codon:yes stop_codon:yes gene_type:complete
MSENGWAEYSRLVLKELETLASGIESLKYEMQDIKQDIALLRDREDRVTELRQWKEKVDEVVSPTQLQNLVKEVDSLKLFKTRAITIFAVAQASMAVFAWALKFIQ